MADPESSESKEPATNVVKATLIIVSTGAEMKKWEQELPKLLDSSKPLTIHNLDRCKSNLSSDPSLLTPSIPLARSRNFFFLIILLMSFSA